MPTGKPLEQKPVTKATAKKTRPVKLPCPNLMTASWRCYPEWYEERMKTKGETNENPDDCAYEK